MNYTADGLRVSKTVGTGLTSHYIYNGTTLVQEKTITSSGTKYITFLYNDEGLTGFVYDNTLYTYRKNLFGDIIAVYQGSTKVAEYAYDAYGKCTVILNTAGIATINPFRYRSYYFDSDLGLYYLQSRYYDPETGRFINADDVSYLDPQSIHGLNLYAYCLNNPVMYVDPTGHVALGLILAIALMVTLSIVGAVAGAIIGKRNNKTGKDLVKSILRGLFIGLAVAGAIIALFGVAVGALAGVDAIILGLSAKTIFAIGALAVDGVSFIVAPILQIEVPSIDYEIPGPVYTPTLSPSSPYHD